MKFFQMKLSRYLIKYSLSRNTQLHNSKTARTGGQFTIRVQGRGKKRSSAKHTNADFSGKLLDTLCLINIQSDQYFQIFSFYHSGCLDF